MSMAVIEYQSALKAVAMLSQMLQQFDIPKILQDIEHADAFGPLFDPTLWIKKQEAMNEDRELLKAALPLWKIGKKLAEGTK